MSFASLSPNARGLILLWGSVILIMYIYNWVRYVQLGKGWASILPRFSLMIFMLAIELWLSALHTGEASRTYDIGIYPLLALFLILLVTAAAEQVGIGRWRRTHLTTASVKEAFDDLPSGLCYFLPSGQPVLVNRLMNEISRLSEGSALLDAEGWWRDLRTGRLPGSIAGGEEPILRLSDGRVYSFRRNSFSVRGGRFYEIVAADVTEEYRLTEELREKQRQARVVNTRLKALIGTIEYVTMSRELLQLKTALHDKIGRSLLYARRYILEPGSVNRERMLSEWRTHIRQLRNQDPELWQHPYYITEKYAAELGIDLTLDGELPTEDALLPLVNTAITVHLTNVLRHAGGKKAVVKTRRNPGGGLELTFTNDGAPPSAPVRETGGLRNLRREVEAAGGSMEIVSSPRFEMKICLP